MTDKKWYTLEETAAKLGVSTEDLNQMAQRGDIKRYQAGKTWQFKGSDVDLLSERLGDGTEASEALTVKPDQSGTSPALPAGGDDVVFDFGGPLSDSASG